MKKETFTVVGLNHYASTFLLGEIEKHLPLKATLKREPDNEFDSNAIAVYIKSEAVVKTNKASRSFKIGHLRRGVAKEIAPGLDSGAYRVVSARLTKISVDDSEGVIEIGLTKGKIHP